MMQTIVRPARDLRNHYAELSELLKDHDHIIITNRGRRPFPCPLRVRAHT